MTIFHFNVKEINQMGKKQEKNPNILKSYLHIHFTKEK